MFVKQMKHVYHVLPMYDYQLYIIQLNNDEFSKLFSENVVHILLKLVKPKGMTIMCSKGCVRNIILIYANFMVARCDIKF